jgi:hypothetical protein
MRSKTDLGPLSDIARDIALAQGFVADYSFETF